MQKASLLPFDMDADTINYLNDTIYNGAKGQIRTQQALQCLLAKPKTTFQKSLRMKLQRSPDAITEIVEHSSKNDFRAFLRNMLTEEQPYLAASLEQIRIEDPARYHQIMQGWAKIGLPQQQDINVNIEVKQKQDMFSRIYEQYGYSQVIEDVEATELQQQQLQAPKEYDPEFVPGDDTEETNTHKLPVSASVASTFDPMFYEKPEETTPSQQE